MKSKLKFIIITVVSMIVALIIVIFTMPTHKRNNNINDQTSSIRDYEIGIDNTDIEYVTKSSELKLENDLGVSRVIYDRIKSKLLENNISEFVVINENTYNSESNLFRYKGIAVDCSDLQNVYLYTLVDNIGLNADLKSKVDNWLKDIDAVGEVVLKSYNYDTGEMQITINNEDKVITVK